MRSNPRTTWIGTGLAVVVAGTSELAGAAGFALVEQSASGLGNAYAGAAATAEDASTVFFNPAGMAFLPGAQVVLAGHAVNLSAEFKDSGASRIPAALPGRPRGGDGGDAGGLVGVPNFYATLPIGEKLAIGIGVNVPFGLKTDYDDTWVGRFQGTKSELTTINVNPSISWRINEKIAVGFGVNYQHADVDLRNAVVLGFNTEGSAKLEADDDTWGWNVGAMFQISPDMRIGVSYRSKMDYTLQGTATVYGPTGAVVPSQTGAASAEVAFPDMFSLSVMQTFGDKWDLLGDITFTRWDEIGVVNVVAANGVTRDQLTFNLDNAWRISLGLNYHHDEHWTFKGGIAWDQTPVSDQYRSARLPDNDRYWLAIGAKYRATKSLSFDVGYTHIFIPDASINQTRAQLNTNPALTTSVVNGTVEGSVDILSVQVAYTF